MDPSVEGVCSINGDKPLTVFVDDHHKLIVIYGFERSEIPLPPSEGRYYLSYHLGESKAYIENWGNVMVRRGPKGFY